MRKLSKLVGVALGGLMLLQSAMANAALDAYLTVTGGRQGTFKSSGVRPTPEVPILAVEHGVTSPREMNTGLASGKRMHEPVTITMPTDAATRQFWTANAGNEVLTSVAITVTTKRATATTRAQSYTISLKNAAIERIVVTPPSKDAAPLTKVSFVFQEIHVTWVNGGVTATDDWEARN